MLSPILDTIMNGFFNCEVGVRQEEHLPPVLFCLYLNDLQTYLEEQEVISVESINKDVENELMILRFYSSCMLTIQY